jgi:NhaP-type Na+/H+ or K+/H+ antiporter
MNTRKQYAFVALSGILGFGAAALVISVAYSGNDNPNSTGIEAQMPLSLTAFLIGVGTLLSLGFIAALIWVEVINPRRRERAHRRFVQATVEEDWTNR